MSQKTPDLVTQDLTTRLTKPVKDPIHDYIPITSLESRIIDSPEFQRLRFILQNSAAYLTYPSNHSTRFSHSLGVMHISGTLFLKALENTDYATLKKLLDVANDIIISSGGSGIERFENRLKYWKEKPCFTHSPYKGAVSKIEYEFDEDSKRHSDYFIICTLWQAIRISALVHDLGHLPMSHVFEDAIKLDKSKRNKRVVGILVDQIERQLNFYKKGFSESEKEQINQLRNKNYPPKFHELRGLFLFQKMKPQILDEDTDIYFEKVVSISENILVSSPKEVCSSNGEKSFKFLGFLHSFFANNFVDVDRLDYTMRDPYSSGLKLAEIDLNTIYSTSYIRRETDKCFYLTHRSSGLSAIEVFFHQRYLLYRNIVYHHNVIRMNAVLKKIIGILLYLAEENSHPQLSNVIEREGLYVKSQENHFLPDNYGPEYDDAWLRTLLVTCKNILHNESFEISEAEDSENDHKLISYLVLLLNTFLYRKTANIYSLWKRESDYYCWVSEAVDNLLRNNPVKPPLNEKTKRKIVESIIITSSEDPRAESLFQKFFDDLRKKLHGQSIWVISESIEPKIYNPDSHGNHVMANDVLLDSSAASPYLSSFDRIASLTPRQYIFFLGEGIKNTNPENMENKKIRVCLNESTLLFREYVKDVIHIASDIDKKLKSLFHCCPAKE
ncbi:MAG: hypothetical protein AB2799_13945 [Candidatus Thiodiazotropha sp.]